MGDPDRLHSARPEETYQSSNRVPSRPDVPLAERVFRQLFASVVENGRRNGATEARLGASASRWLPQRHDYSKSMPTRLPSDSFIAPSIAHLIDTTPRQCG